MSAHNQRSTAAGLVGTSIAHAPVGYRAFPTCTFVADGTPAVVLEDLSPGTRFLHIVRARVSTPLSGPVEGYAYSVGLSRY